MNIHQIWIGSEDDLDKHTPWVQSVKNTYRDHVYKLWREEDCIELLESRFEHLLPLYHDYRYVVNRCDMMRYIILYTHGGMYFDLDVVSYKDITPEIQAGCVLFEGRDDSCSDYYFPKNTKYLVNCVMYSEKNNIFMKRCINNLSRHAHKYDHLPQGQYVIMTTANGFLTNMYHTYNRLTDIKTCSSKMYEFYDKHTRKLIIENKVTPDVTDQMYGLHLNTGVWISDEQSPYKIL